MMQELSLHILDIAQNSIVAQSSLIEISVLEDTVSDRLEILVMDNGKGMSQEFVKTVTDPFSTSRTTRRVGLGIPMFKMAAQLAAGDLEITSELGKGTVLKAWFSHSHIDRQPLGDMSGTIFILVQSNPDIDFVYTHRVDDNEFEFSTIEIKKVLGDVPLNSPDIALWIRDYLNEGITGLYGDTQY